jgi:hypothetical protein
MVPCGRSTFSKQSTSGVSVTDMGFQIIRISSTLSTLPQLLAANEAVDWIPVDILSSILLEFLFAPANPSGPRSCQFHNCVNPNPVSWGADLLPTVVANLQGRAGERAQLSVVPYMEWLATAQSASDAATNIPSHEKDARAFALLDFLSNLGQHEGRPRFLTNVARSVSPILRTLDPVNPTWMEIWLQQWLD